MHTLLKWIKASSVRMVSVLACWTVVPSSSPGLGWGFSCREFSDLHEEYSCTITRYAFHAGRLEMTWDFEKNMEGPWKKSKKNDIGTRFWRKLKKVQWPWKIPIDDLGFQNRISLSTLIIYGSMSLLKIVRFIGVG